MPLESVPKSLGGKFELYNESYDFDTSAAGPFYTEPTVTSTASSSDTVAGKVDVNRVLSTSSSTSNGSNNSSMSSVLDGIDINERTTAATSGGGATATSTSVSVVADDVQDAVSNAPFLVAATASATTPHAVVASSGHHHHTTKHKHRHTSPHSQTQHTTAALPASHADVSAQIRLNKHAHCNAQDPSSSSQHHTNTTNITTPTKTAPTTATKTTPSSSGIRSIFSRSANALTPQSLSKLPSRVNSFRHPSSHMNSTATAGDAMLKRSRSMFSPASSSSFQQNSPISTPTTKETVSAVVNTSYTTTTTTAAVSIPIICSTPVYIGILGIFIWLFLFYPIVIVKYVIIPVLFGLFVVYVI